MDSALSQASREAGIPGVGELGVVESAWGAVPGLLPIRFPRPTRRPSLFKPCQPVLIISEPSAEAARPARI